MNLNLRNLRKKPCAPLIQQVYSLSPPRDSNFLDDDVEDDKLELVQPRNYITDASNDDDEAEKCIALAREIRAWYARRSTTPQMRLLHAHEELVPTNSDSAMIVSIARSAEMETAGTDIYLLKVKVGFITSPKISFWMKAASISIPHPLSFCQLSVYCGFHNPRFTKKRIRRSFVP